MRKGDRQLNERNNKQCKQNTQRKMKSRKRKHEHSASRTFVRRNNIKSQDKADDQ